MKCADSKRKILNLAVRSQKNSGIREAVRVKEIGLMNVIFRVLSSETRWFQSIQPHVNSVKTQEESLRERKSE